MLSGSKVGVTGGNDIEKWFLLSVLIPEINNGAGHGMAEVFFKAITGVSQLISPNQRATCREPFVSVPVLSNQILPGCWSACRTSPPLIMILCCAARPIATAIASGVAKAKAQGQATMSKAMLRSNAISRSVENHHASEKLAKSITAMTK